MIYGDWLRKWSLVVPDKAAVIDIETGSEISYHELNQRADRVACMLRDRYQVSLGDRVAVLGLNRIEQIDLFFAAAKLGAILVPVNWRLAPDEVAYILGNCEPRVLFYGEDIDATVKALSHGLWAGAVCPLDGSGADGFKTLVAQSAAEPVTTERIGQDTPLLLLYTSGTTGRPKGAVLTHGTITWNSVNTTVGWDLHHDDVSLIHTPFFHTGGWNVLTLPLLHRGATVVLARRYDASETIRAVARYRMTLLFAVPTMFQMMLDSPEMEKADFSSVRFFISGGSACPIPLIEAFQKRGLTFKQGYGLTEVGPNCFVLHEKDAIRKAGSVGFPVLHLDTRIVDGSGSPVPRGEVGELQLRGPTVCAGYWRDPDATAKATTADGWFATGDLFRQDADGYHFVVDRLKEMYKSGGENVYPAEVERVLYQIPEVVEAAVIGVPDEKWGEVGHAFVALNQEARSRLSSDSILDYCKQHLAKFKVPRRLVILDTLPKGSSGKILKKQLRELGSRSA